jgi:hypothetical protein
MDLTAFSLLSKDQEKNLTIGSLSLCVGSSGLVCLLDPIKSGLLTRDTTIMTTLEASVGSSSEANSLVSTKLTKNTIIEGLDEIMGNLDLEESSGTSSVTEIGNISEKDFITSNGDLSKNSENRGSSKQMESYQEGSQGASSLHQVYVIISDTSEEVDDENNPVINPHNLERGVNYRAEGETTPREKVHLLAEEWQMIKAAVHRGAAIPADSRREVVMGYQYALHQQKKQTIREKSEIRRMHKSTIKASRIL